MRKQNPTEAVADDDLQEWIQELVVGAQYMEIPEQAAKDALSIFTVYWIASQTGDKEEMERAEAGLSQGDLWYRVRVECMARLKRMRAVAPNAWKLFTSLLQQRCLPSPLQRKVEQAVRFWSRRSVAIRPKQRGRAWDVEAEARAYISALEEMRGQITTAKEAYSAPQQCAASEQAKDLRMEVGPFTLVNSGGFSKEFMQGSADSLGQAVVLLEKKGLGFVCYGEAHMTNRIARSSVAAQYVSATDTFMVRGFKKGTHETVAYMIHELGHRLIDKFMSKETKRLLFDMYRTANTASFTRRYESKDDEKYLPKIGDTYVQGRKVLEVTKVMPTRIYLKLQGYEESPSFHIAPEAWAENARMKAGVIPDFGFVNKYSRTNEEENFCEMLRFYCMGKLPVSQAALIEPVLQQAIKDAASLPSRNPAEPLDVKVDRFLASGYLRVDPLKYRTMFAKHASEIGQPEPVGEMLGCGGFGCVWPTTKPGVAMKATKDESEPVIVRMLTKDKKVPAGFARYTHMSSIGGFTLLWREEVEPHQGKDFLPLYEYQLYAQTAHEIYEWAEFKDEWAELVNQLGGRMAGWDAKPGKSRGIIVPVLVDGKVVDLESWEPSDDYAETMGMRFILAWQAARHVATQLRKNKELKAIADAILWAMSKGIMLCDVTSVNLGYVKRGAKKQLVIYDPGHTVNVPIPSTTNKNLSDDHATILRRDQQEIDPAMVHIGNVIAKTVRSKAGMAILDSDMDIWGGDWDAGGCRALAEALIQIFPESSRLAGVVEDPERNNAWGHVVVDWDGVLFDSNGAHTKQGLIDFMKARDGMPRAIVTYDSPFDEEVQSSNIVTRSIRKLIWKKLQQEHKSGRLVWDGSKMKMCIEHNKPEKVNR